MYVCGLYKECMRVFTSKRQKMKEPTSVSSLEVHFKRNTPYLNLPMAANVLRALLPFGLLDLFSHLFSLSLICFVIELKPPSPSLELSELLHNFTSVLIFEIKGFTSLPLSED